MLQRNWHLIDCYELDSQPQVIVYQLLVHGRWFSPGTPASSTTKTGRHDIAESGVKDNKNQIRSLTAMQV